MAAIWRLARLLRRAVPGGLCDVATALYALFFAATVAEQVRGPSAHGINWIPHVAGHPTTFSASESADSEGIGALIHGEGDGMCGRGAP